MGKVFKKVTKPFKRVFKNIKKPVSKLTKGIAKGIAKVGKAVMRGVSKLQNKLGPLGSIALAIALPAALGGLSTLTTNMMNYQAVGSWGNFVRSAGTMMDSIRTGYQFGTGKFKAGWSKITDRISQGFSKIGKGNNIFSKISDGAKRLYKSSQQNFAKVFGKKGSAGKVEVWDKLGYATDGPAMMSIEEAAKLNLSNYELGKQTVGSKAGWFTQELTTNQINSKKLITDTINDAYADTLKNYSKDATRFFTDVKTQMIDAGTYLNDAQVGEILLDNGAKQNLEYINLTDYDMTGNKGIVTDFDISKSKDYISLNEAGTEYQFNGSQTFNTGGKKPVSTMSKIKKAAVAEGKGLLKKSLLAKTDYAAPVYEVADKDMTLEAVGANYTGTNIKGTEGGSLFATVYGNEALNSMKDSVKRMNIRFG